MSNQCHFILLQIKGSKGEQLKLVVQLGRRTIDGGTQEEENKASNLMLHPIYRLNGCGDCVKDDSTMESHEH